MKYFLTGIILSLTGILVSLVVWGMDKAYYITGVIGILLIGVSMISSGSLVSGDRMRANFATESVEDRRNRNSITFRSAMIGIPNLVIATVIYFFLN